MGAKKNVVTIGGGTGTFVVLSGLKHIPDINLTAIVSVLDDGGSTGRLRDAYGFLPVGDARQALIALAKNGGSSLMRRLFAYRFSKGDIGGHNFGNLFLTALTDILGSDAAAIEAASIILRVKGKVLPVSEKPATLVAELKDGSVIEGEHFIDERVIGRPHIVSLKTKEPVFISSESQDAIRTADLIILGPGDLYASTLAEFAVSGLREAIQESSARIVYIVNLFTKSGQTDGFTASQHVAEIAAHTGRQPNIVLCHEGSFPDDVLERYADEHEFPVKDDLPRNTSTIVHDSFADVFLAKKVAGDIVPRSLVRHSSEKLAAAIRKFL